MIKSTNVTTKCRISGVEGDSEIYRQLKSTPLVRTEAY